MFLNIYLTQKNAVIEKQRNQNKQKRNKYKEKMEEVSPILSIFTLNLYELKTSIKIQITEWIKINYPTTYCIQETYIRFKDTNRFKVKA